MVLVVDVDAGDLSEDPIVRQLAGPERVDTEPGRAGVLRLG